MISIIIPIYNKGQHLRKCLESVRKQSFTDFECIMIDNNSTDNSIEICRDFLSDSRFTLASCKLQGVSAARNMGIDLAKGEWIMFIDADDWIEDDFVLTMCNLSQEHLGYMVYTCCAKTFRTASERLSIWNNLAQGERTKDEVDNFKANVRWATVWNALWRAEVFKGEGRLRFNTKVYVGEDELVCVEYWMKYGKLYHTSYNGYNHYINSTSISMQYGNYRKCASEILCILENLMHKYDTLTPVVKQELRNLYSSKLSKHNVVNIDYVVPYTTNTASYIKSLLQDKEDYYESPYYQDIELNKRYNKEDNIFHMQVRSIAKYMPYIRTLHLIVENEQHVPEWIDKERVHIVYHKDFIPSELLPTYNCNTIESYLGNIPFLADRFIYANSDYIALKELPITKFFSNLMTRNTFRRYKLKAKQFANICRSSYHMIFERKQGDILLAPLIHCFTPMVTSRVKEVQSKYEDKIKSVCTPFRKGFNINQYIYPFYDLKQGYCIMSDLISYTIIDNIDKLKLASADVVCLEDMDDDNPLVKVVEEYTSFEKCKYEK